MSNSEQQTDELNFKIGQGRTRPQYKPKALQCPNCGSPLEVATETTMLITCPACDSNLDLGAEETQILGKNKKRTYTNLNIPLQTELVFEGESYKVIARMAYQDGWGDYTYEYLLFNPFFGSFYLSRYENDYSTSRPARSFLEKDPFSSAENEILNSFDGKQWRFEEKSTMKLRYVEGALPWLAKKGDTHEYSALVSTQDSNIHLEVEREIGKEGSELEYVRTQSLPLSILRNAIVDKELRDTLFPPPPPPKSKVPFVLAFVISVLGIIFGANNLTSGERVTSLRLEPTDLIEDRISRTFEITKNKYPVEFCFSSNVNNEWMYAQWAIIKSKTEIDSWESYDSFVQNQSKNTDKSKDDYLVHIADEEISYYYGGSGEDSWSEGSRSNCHKILFSETGYYRLVTKAVSGQTENEPLPKNRLNITVHQGAKIGKYFGYFIVFSVLFAIRSFVGIIKTK